MRTRSIITYASTVAALAGMPFLAQRLQAAPTPFLGQVSIQFGHPHQEYHPNWNDDQKRELRHILYRLEHANKDYEGHRDRAVHEIHRAGEAMGMDMHGPGYEQQWQGSPNYGGYGQQTESQEWSDNILRRQRDRLNELANSTEDPVRHDLLDAVHELDMALQVR